MWRPEGWKNPYGMYTSDGRYDDFEDGADAMLRAIKGMAQMKRKGEGYYVIIPEEIENEH